MKKRLLNKGSIIKAPFFIVALLSVSLSALPRASANADLDRQYALETLGYLKAWDNMDGLFADYVASAYKEYFSRQSRFVVQDLSKADTVLSHSKIPYGRLIEDADILGQVARATRAESIVRTRISKEGRQYRFILEWLHSPKMEVMAKEDFTMEEPEGGKPFGSGEIQGKLGEALERMIAKVPFKATVTGRDNNAVTVNIGENAGLKKGDVLVISTLDEVKKHPLLKTIVDWRLSRTGKVEVEQAEEGLAFGKVIEEEPSRNIGRYQKVVQILPYGEHKTEPEVVDENKEQAKQIEETPPRLGWASVGVLGGSGSRQISSISGGGVTGGGFTFGVNGEGELWLNKEFFFDVGFRYGFGSLSQTDLNGVPTPASTAGGLTTSVFSVKGSIGYSYLVSGDFFGPKGWVKLGFQSTTYGYPLSAAEQLFPVTYGSAFAGIGGDLPIRAGFGAILNLDFGLFNSASPTPGALPSNSVNSASGISFFVGGYYRATPRLTLRAGLDVIANGAEISGGYSLTQKVVSFAPALLYYF